MDENKSTFAFQAILTSIKERVIQRGELPHISVKDQLKYIDELRQFPLGRVLLEKGLIDTYWTDFLMTHPDQRGSSNLEDFILNRSPFVRAWRELLCNFRKIAQEALVEGSVIASIPCGAMRELLDLDYSALSSFELIGIDIDPNSLLLAEQTAKKRALSSSTKLYQADAWNLPYNGEIDVITSCGLNIYVSNQNEVLDLYRQFFKSLKIGGKLLIGFLTYPPQESKDSEWLVDEISPEDLLLERVLYKDILDLKWRNFRTSREFENELRQVGFSDVIFYYDALHVFPVVVAIK